MPCQDPTERIVANPNPTWTGNAHSSFRFHKWEFSGLVDVKKGGDVWNGTKGALYSYGTHKDTEIRATCTGALDGELHGQRTRDRRVGLLSWPGHRSGRGSQIPGRRERYRNSGLAACPFTGIDDPCICVIFIC